MSPVRLFRYWVGIMACCVLGGMIFNMVTPPPLSWYNAENYALSSAALVFLVAGFSMLSTVDD